MLQRLIGGVLDHPRTVLVGWAALVLLALLGVSQLRVDFSSASFYGDDAAELAELRSSTARWGPDDRTLALVVHAPDDMLSDAGLDGLAALEHAVATAPSVVSTTSLASATGPGSTSLQTQWADLDAPERALVRSALHASPAVPLFLSEDHHDAVVQLELDRSTDDLAAAVEAVGAVRDALPPAPTGWTMELAGVPAIRAAFFALTVRDQALLGPLALVIAVAGLFAFTRRLQVAAVAAVGAGVPPLLLAGAMGLGEIPVGLLTQALFTMLPIIAVADTVHVVLRVRSLAASTQHRATERAVIEAAMADIGWACGLTSLTTALGFASMVFADLPLLRAFGLWAAAGVLVAYLVVLTLLPVVLSALDVGVGAPSGSAVLRRLARASVSRPIVVVLLTVAALAWSLHAAQSVVVDNHLGALLRPDHPVRQAGSTLDTKLGGTLTLSVERDHAEGLADADASELRSLVASTPGVRAVEPVQRDDDGVRVVAHIPDIGGIAFADLEARLDHTLAEQGWTTRTTSTASVAYRGVNRITSALRISLAFVLLVVLGVVALMFRSPGLALRSFLPNVMPLLLGYALVGAASLELDPIGVVILAVALGIAIDDTLHVLAGFASARARGLGRADAAVDAVATRGHAIVITSVVLVAGLSVNALSAFPPLQVLGTLGATVIALAMLADITLLPMLLAWPARPSEALGSRTESGSRAEGPR
ncbi:MAG: MMPL family transporter [Myxococcota bacterium]